MKLLKSICIASALGANVPEPRSDRQCYIPDLAQPHNWLKWECFDKNGDGPIPGPNAPAGSKCYLDCKAGFSEYNRKSFNSTIILKNVVSTKAIYFLTFINY